MRLKCNIKEVTAHAGDYGLSAMAAPVSASLGGPLCAFFCLWQELNVKDFSPLLVRKWFQVEQNPHTLTFT